MNTRTFAKHLVILTVLGFLAACGGDNSTPAPPPPIAAITAQPTDQSVVAGTAATFNVVASNATGYQWQSSSDGGTTFVDVTGATVASHTTAASTLPDSGTKYRVVVAGVGNSVTSSAATLTVTAAVVAPSINVHPAAQTITAGQNASFSVTASGTSLRYQWQRSTDSGTSFADMAGASNATLTLTAVAQGDNAQQFRVVVSNSAGSVTSNAATLTVNAASVAAAFTLHPNNQSVTAPAAATFTAAAVGTPTPTLQWQVNVAGSWSDIAGATASSYTTPATIVGDSGKQYRVMATNATANVTSNAASLTVSVPVAPSFTTQPASVTITAGQSTQFTVAVSGTPTPTLQWQLSTDNGGTWGNITGETGTTYTALNVALANNGRQFRAVASNGVGSAVNSNAATLTVTSSATTPPAFGKIAVGDSHTCAVKADATVACWGKGSSREVLPGSGFSQDIPVTVPGLSGITQVAVGFQRSCALNTNGNLLCWGRGNGTGIGTITDSANVPYAGIKAIVLGAYHTCFIDAGTTVQCWGDDSVGQLGQGSVSITPAVNPVIVRRLNSAPLTGVVSLAAGSFYTCALKSDGEVVCWGSGAIGDGTQLALRAIVPAVTGANAIASGGGHVCAAMAVGGIKCWGVNSSGQLGNGNRVPQLLPISVADPQGLLTGVTRIAMEAKNTCAVRANPANGQVICWGSVAPNNTTNLYTAPTAKGTSTQLISAVSGGFEHTCALMADGSMECWGGNLFGQLGIGGTIGVFTGGPTPPDTSVIGGAIFWK